MTAQETVAKRFRERSRQHGDRPATHTKDQNGVYVPSSFAQTWHNVGTLGCALMRLGVERGAHVAIMSDNRQEWLWTDLAVLGIGAADVPRGSDSTAEEMAYIINHADCALVFAEDPRQCEKILSKRSSVPNLKRMVLFDDYATPAERPSVEGVEILSFADLMRQEPSADERAAFEQRVDEGHTDEVATLLYTSGTTGEPKGVMLRHRSFLFQMDRIEKILFLTPRDIFLSVLPIWHSFERAVCYIALNYGSSIAYSKPIGKIMLEDMARIRPMWLTSVPRIWEGVRAAVYRNVSKQSAVKQTLFHFFVGVGEMHSDLADLFFGRAPRFTARSRMVDTVAAAVPLLLLTPLRLLGNALVFKSLKQKLGGRFVAGVSGGGAMPTQVDRFFRAAGIKVLEGYGLTETGPVLAVRLQNAPVPGTVGPLLPDIEYKLIAEDGREVGPGEKGVLHVKSEQVMVGYYKKPEETAKVLNDGWLNTGDICVFTYDGECRIVGRAKETIVLMGGENVEPAPIEEAILRSELIEQVMVVGQDRKFLAALVIPNEEALTELAKSRGIDYVDVEELADNPQVQERIHEEIKARVNTKAGFKVFEQIFRFKILSKPFTVGEELTQTLKLRRAVVHERYRREIDKLFE